uniref:AlNc14C109G6319 protein n=2 Tax=Albugo laibachii Nc14 TaxID=890382 RepID=F0WIB6_9STRA|nr:AlNc14C109G6319 [Albugo laibachii Nc14]|eukprot:CCA20995.1 AlNc14C109G6319 [Albugo laibachii Nc14]
MAAIVNSTTVQFMYNMLEVEHHVSEVHSKPILDGTWLSDITNETLAEDGIQSECLKTNTYRLTACFAFDNNLNNTSYVPSFYKRKASSPRTASPLSPFALRNALSFVLIEILAIKARLHSNHGVLEVSVLMSIGMLLGTRRCDRCLRTAYYATVPISFCFNVARLYRGSERPL